MTTRQQAATAFEAAAPLFTVLADPYRQQILLDLGTTAEGRNVNEITEKLALSRPAVSHHLLLLKQAGLVAVTKHGTQNIYTLTLKASIQQIRALMDLLEASCERGNH